MQILSVTSLGKGRYKLELENGEYLALYKKDAQVLGLGKLRVGEASDKEGAFPAPEQEVGLYVNEQEVQVNPLLYLEADGKLRSPGPVKELSDDAYRILTEEILPERARTRAMFLLAKRDYTSAELRDKLKSGHYQEKCIDDVLQELRDLGYLDDKQYALDYIGAHLEGKGKRRLKADLMRKGIGEDIFEEAYQEIVLSKMPSGGTGFCDNDLAGENGGSKDLAQEAIYPEDAQRESEQDRIKRLLEKKHYSGKNADDKERRRFFGFLARRGFSPGDIMAVMREYPGNGD